MLREMYAFAREMEAQTGVAIRCRALTFAGLWYN